MAPIKYLYFGLHGKTGLVPWMWTALLFNGAAFIIFLIPKLRHNALTLNIGAGLIIVGVYIEKGMGLVVPGFIPSPLGEIYQYWPALSEVVISIGIWATGAFLFTLMAKLAITVHSEDHVKPDVVTEAA
jgi:molybdopterin-containing oxidoreductase family membrane subunit